MLYAFAAAAGLIQASPVDAAPLVEYDPVLAGSVPFRRIFIDAMVVEESHGLERVFHAATKYEKNPVFVKGEPWEGWGPSIGGTVIRDGDKLRMYYYCLHDDYSSLVCVAESRDGLRWTRPIVGEVEYNGCTKNNIVKCCQQVFKVARPTSPDRRWITYGFRNDRVSLGYSPDGLKWKWQERDDGLFTSSDVINWFYDPYQNRICATWKTSSRRHRSVGVAWSSDLEHWTKPIDGPVFVPDDLDPDPTQIYGMPVFAYQKSFIGLAWIYHARWIKYGRYTKPEVMYEAQVGSPRTIDVQLAWSWDLINWTRTPRREPFIDNGPFKRFDCGLAFTAREPIVMGDELWFYYTGWDQIHEDYEGITSAVGLAKLRLDGFCSMRAGDKEGWLISRREVFNTPRVRINAKCAPGGYVAADLVDRSNDVIPGFEKERCNAFVGDSVRGEITWKTAKFAKDWIDKDKKVRFYVKSADLYSYLPEDINQKIDDGWPDH